MAVGIGGWTIVLLGNVAHLLSVSIQLYRFPKPVHVCKKRENCWSKTSIQPQPREQPKGRASLPARIRLRSWRENGLPTNAIGWLQNIGHFYSLALRRISSHKSAHDQLPRL